MPRSVKATESLRLAELDILEQGEKAALTRQWESKKIKFLANFLNLNQPQITRLQVCLLHIDEKYQRTKRIRDCSGNLPVWGGVQYSPGQIAALLEGYDKIPKSDIPAALDSEIARLTHDGAISFEQARKLIFKKYYTMKKQGKDKRTGALAAQYAAALLLRFIELESPNTAIKCRNLFIHETLKALGIKHPGLSTPSVFRNFIKDAERFRQQRKVEQQDDEEFEAQFSALAEIHF